MKTNGKNINRDRELLITNHAYSEKMSYSTVTVLEFFFVPEIVFLNCHWYCYKDED